MSPKKGRRQFGWSTLQFLPTQLAGSTFACRLFEQSGAGPVVAADNGMARGWRLSCCASRDPRELVRCSRRFISRCVLVVAGLQVSCGGRAVESSAGPFPSAGGTSDGEFAGGAPSGGSQLGGAGAGGFSAVVQGGSNESPESIVNRSCRGYCTAIMGECGDAIVDAKRTTDPAQCVSVCEVRVGDSSADCRASALAWMDCLKYALSGGNIGCKGLPEWVAAICDEQARAAVTCELATPCIWRLRTGNVLQSYCGTDIVESSCYWDQSGRDPVEKCWCGLNGMLVASSSETAPASIDSPICPEFFP